MSIEDELRTAHDKYIVKHGIDIPELLEAAEEIRNLRILEKDLREEARNANKTLSDACSTFKDHRAILMNMLMASYSKDMIKLMLNHALDEWKNLSTDARSKILAETSEIFTEKNK